jgi:hypothetical protein
MNAETFEDLFDGNPSATTAQPDASPAIEPSSAESGAASENAAGDKSAATPPAAAGQGDNAPLVPRKALEDERRKRQDYEKRMADLERQLQAISQPQQQRQPPPDPVTDPEGAFVHYQRQQEHQLHNYRFTMSRDMMLAIKPDYEEVEAAFVAAAETDVGLQQKLFQSANPAKFAYEQGLRLRALAEIGDDPAAYKARLRAELEAEFNARGAAPVANPPKAPGAPKSLASTPAASQPRQKDGRYAGPASLEDLIG